MKQTLTLFAALIFCIALSAQAPQMIRYQGVARDAAGLPIANGTITVQFEIHDVSVNGPVIYTETHAGVITNTFGIFNLSIGSINPLPTNIFTTGDEFLEVSVDFGSGLTSMGTSQLLSVPYAMYADSCGNPGPQGPTGPAGPTGATGATGATGPSGTTGQNIFEVYGTGQLVVTNAMTTYTLIPGLTQTVNVPANSLVYVSSTGGIQSTGATSSSYSVVDVGLFVDGVATTSGGQRRISIANTSSLAQLIGNWTLTHTYSLSAGNHTFEVRAVNGAPGSSNANVSSSAAPQLQGVLTVMIIRL